MQQSATGIARRQARRILTLVDDDLSLRILVVAADDHNEVDQRPDAASAQRDELNDADDRFAGVETVDAERSEEEAEQQRREPVLVAGVGRNDRTALSGCAASRAHKGVVGNLFAAV